MLKLKAFLFSSCLAHWQSVRYRHGLPIARCTSGTTAGPSQGRDTINLRQSGGQNCQGHNVT